MEIEFTAPNNAKVINPSYENILEYLHQVEQWGIAELQCNQNGKFHSQLIIIVEKSSGYILRHCNYDGSEESISLNKENTETQESITTFDGGDDFVVPLRYVHQKTTLQEPVEYFLKTGNRIDPVSWGVLGIDI